MERLEKYILWGVIISLIVFQGLLLNSLKIHRKIIGTALVILCNVNKIEIRDSNGIPLRELFDVQTEK